MTKGAGTAPSRDIESVERSVGETELESSVEPRDKGKAKEQTAAVESVPHIPISVLPAEAPATPVQLSSLPSPYDHGPRFSAQDMAEAETSITVKKRVASAKGETRTHAMIDEPPEDWSEEHKTWYQRDRVQMVLGGRTNANTRVRVLAVFKSTYVEDVTPEQGLVDYLFRGCYTQGLDTSFFMVSRSAGPEVYPSWATVSAQDVLNWSQQEKKERKERHLGTDRCAR
jgi:hypothetical protein